MKYYVAFVLSTLISVSMAQVPMLDSSTITMPKSKALNKCIDENNKIIYTQFECSETAVKADKKWIEQANLTFAMPDKYTLNPLKAWAEEQKSLNEDKSLEEMIEGKNIGELLNMGIQAYLQRAVLMNSL